MKDKISFFLLFFSSFALSIHADLPDTLQLRKGAKTFHVSSDEKELSSVVRVKNDDNSIEYHYKDLSGETLAKGLRKKEERGVLLEVFGKSEDLLARVKKVEWANRMDFRITSSEGKLALYGKENFLKTKIVFLHGEKDTPVITLTRAFPPKFRQFDMVIEDQEALKTLGVDESVLLTASAFLLDHKTKEGFKATASVDSPEANELAAIFQLLEALRPKILIVNPSQEDFAFVMQLIDTLFSKIDRNDEDASGALLEKGVAEILPLFSNDALTQGQKAALFLIVERFLKNLGE